MQHNPYTAGYEAAYREIWEALADPQHPAQCGTCRPCGVMREVVDVLMATLAGKMTQEEFFTLAMILARVSTGERDAAGNAFTDWWTAMHGRAGGPAGEEEEGDADGE